MPIISLIVYLITVFKKYIMKYLVSTLLVICLIACESNKKSVDSSLTGTEVTYTLYQGSDYNISGTVTFKETQTQSTVISIDLSGTDKGLLHPTHLHFDNIEGNGDIAAVLNPVDGTTGISTTTLEEFEDASKVTYQQLLELEASIKVHLSATQPGKSIILAGGNVGLSDSKKNPFGRVNIAVCKSN